MTRFAFVDEEKALYAVALLCRLMKVSRAGYYAWTSRAPCAREVADGVLTTQIRPRSTAIGRSLGHRGSTLS